MRDEEGPRDLERSMRLLWRAHGEPDPAEATESGAAVRRRGPKPALSVEQIVLAAIEIADAEGLGGLSMRKVAERLGVGTMSLYTYVPAKAELVSLMLDAVDARGSLPHTVEGGWREQTAAWAREDWLLYQRHEWMLQASGRQPLGPNTMRRFDSALRALRETGLPQHELVAAADVIDSYTRGMAVRAAESRQLERRTGTSEQAWWDEHGPQLGARISEATYPAVYLAWQSGAFDSDNDIDSFEYGLQRILDGIEGRVTGED
ncbi:TetR/AcrR family transcriptional regulator [Saccharomonospora sp. NPDC006951]